MYFIGGLHRFFGTDVRRQQMRGNVLLREVSRLLMGSFAPDGLCDSCVTCMTGKCKTNENEFDIICVATSRSGGSFTLHGLHRFKLRQCDAFDSEIQTNYLSYRAAMNVQISARIQPTDFDVQGRCREHSEYGLTCFATEVFNICWVIPGPLPAWCLRDTGEYFLISAFTS